jgi:RNA-directed DNA polymerase
VNTDASWPSLAEARPRVLGIQTKLHRWAGDDPDRRFDDLFNLVVDPATLIVAWARVRGNKGARSAGVDGQTARSIEAGRGVGAFLSDLRSELKGQRFTPLPVREQMIPKGAGKWRRLGIPATRDRVVQAALALVLEPILEADFAPCSYGFRPNRRAHDAIAEVHMFASNGYTWAFEGDIEACFDNIDHTALMGRLRRRVGDKRVLALVKAFLKAGILGEDQVNRETRTGTPQGGILSPLLANLALSVLDDHFARIWQQTSATRVDRARRRRHGQAVCRLVRYADDFVVMVNGSGVQAEALREEVAAVLAEVGLRLAPEKTKIAHIDEGFDLLGFRIQRHAKQGDGSRYIYTYPSKKALASVTRKVKAISRQGTNQPLSEILRQLELLLRGWTTYFRHAASNATFGYLRHYTWRRVVLWLRAKHRKASWKYLRRRYTVKGWWPEQDGIKLFDPAAVAIIRYRYRGARIPTPWTQPRTPAPACLA